LADASIRFRAGYQPATQPAAVFKPDDQTAARSAPSKPATARAFHGPISTRRKNPIRIWIEAEKQYQDIRPGHDPIHRSDGALGTRRQEWKFKPAAAT